jgi:hypothetical protein
VLSAGTCKQRGAPMRAGRDRGGDGAAKEQVGDGVHRSIVAASPIPSAG